MNNRYVLHEPLGSGGMGIVYRASDRLTRQVVAVKQLVIPAEFLAFMPEAALLSLAREFELVASLRHPHIISVLDYGFDEQGSPFLVMELVEGGKHITSACQNKSLDYRIQCLIQTLQALDYLHRRGVIHRDIKPGNILVHHDQVKMLDFGLSMLRGNQTTHEEPSGTPAYIAPEILRQEAVGETADLYAVGIIAFELFAGKVPFHAPDFDRLIDLVLSTEPDYDLLIAPHELITVIKRLLAKDPAQRYPSASAALQALGSAIGYIPEESSAIRESYLQAATFVGRETEMKQLSDALQKAAKGQGSLWLIGGESGVGKSRLLDELRIRALVQGIQVLRGQGVAEGGLSYELWRNVTRRMILMSEIDLLTASILKEIVPDIGTLLEMDVPDAPKLEGNVAQQRLVGTIVDLFRRQSQPMLLLLEDLQWAAESLAPLRQLLPMLETLPLLLVATYRTDEATSLPQQLAAANLLELKRFDRDNITQLATSMLGEAALQPQLLDLLHRETEGNVFFMVETIRALAEEAGRLREIGQMALPKTVLAGGVQQVIRRRLDHVPEAYRPLLKLAAVAGRQLDLKVLQTVQSQVDLEAWLQACANVAVLDIQDERWRFAHDKLRDSVLQSLHENELPLLHQQVAEAIERTYTADDTYAPVLVDHWQKARHSQKVRQYALIAAKQANNVSNFQTALALCKLALSLSADEAGVLEIQLLRLLGDVHERMSDYPPSQAAYQRSLELSQSLNDHTGHAAALRGLGRIAYNLGDYQTARNYYNEGLELSRSTGNKEIIANCLNDLGNVAYRQSEFSRSKTYYEESLALYREIDSQSGIASSLSNLGNVANDQGNYVFARVYIEESLNINRQLGNRYGVAFCLNNLGNIASTQHDYPAARDYFEQTVVLSRELGNRYVEAIGHLNLGLTSYALADLSAAHRYFEDSLKLSEQLGNRFTIAYSYHGLGMVAFDRKEDQQAQKFLDQSLTIRREINDQSGVAEDLSFLALIYLRQGQAATARACLQEALTVARSVGSPAGILTVLYGIARLCHSEKRLTESARLVGLLKHHPSTAYEIREYRLSPLLDELTVALSAAELNAALAEGAVLELEAVSEACLEKMA